MRLTTPDLSRRRQTLVAAAFVGALAICWSCPGYKQIRADTYLLLYWGRWIAVHGIPHREVFTLAAAGRPLADQQWLAGLIDFEAWKVAGYNGLALLTALVFGSGFALLTALMRRRGASLILAVGCATLALFGTIGLTFIRAQIFAIPLFISLLWLCLADSDQAGMRWRVVLVLPLLALWANLHGSVLIGIVLACIYCTYRASTMARRGSWGAAGAYVLLGAAAALMTFATPYGIHILTYYREMLGNRALGLADIEWDSPRLPTLGFFQFAFPLMLSCGAVLALIVKGRRPSSLLIGAAGITAVAAWVDFSEADKPRWLLAARGYQVLLAATVFQPALVQRLGRLANSSVLAHDSRGIAVSDSRATCTTRLERAGVIASRSVLARAQETPDG